MANVRPSPQRLRNPVPSDLPMMQCARRELGSSLTGLGRPAIIHCAATRARDGDRIDFVPHIGKGGIIRHDA